MFDPLLLVALALALFVGYNVGGATTAPAFGPAVGANLASKTLCGGLMAAFFLVGAWTLGRRVVDTLGSGLVTDPGVFTPETSVVVLGFVGLALFAGNRLGVPASTSMTTVGAIAGLGLANGTLDRAVLGAIVVWWLLAPVAGFLLAAAAGRYLYPRIEDRLAVHRGDGPLVGIDRSGRLPRPAIGAATREELLSGGFVVGIGCLMAFSSGTSNVANVIAPLVGGGDVAMDPGILLGSGAVAVGAVTLARRTLDTLGNELAALPLAAAAVVAPVSALLVIALSALGVPASFVIVATMAIAGVGWGRATRRSGADSGGGAVASDGGVPDGSGTRVFDPATTARVVLVQHAVPGLATLGAYLTFRFVPAVGS